MTLQQLENTFKLFGYNNVKISENNELYIIKIEIKSFRKLNLFQKKYLIENKPVLLLFEIYVKLPIINYKIQKIII